VHARKFLEGESCVLPHIYNTQHYIDHLQNSTFLADIDHIVDCFDKTTKLRFRSSDEPQYIKFGGTRDNDESCNIRFGQLKLLGSDVAKFFEPSVDCIVNAVLEQRRMAHKPISVCHLVFLVAICPELGFQHVVLVGGFAASDWLFNEVHQKLLPHGLNIIRPQNHVSVLPFFFFDISCINSLSNIQEQGCFRWCPLLLSRPLCTHSSLQVYLRPLLRYCLRSRGSRPQTPKPHCT